MIDSWEWLVSAPLRDQTLSPKEVTCIREVLASFVHSERKWRRVVDLYLQSIYGLDENM